MKYPDQQVLKSLTLWHISKIGLPILPRVFAIVSVYLEEYVLIKGIVLLAELTSLNYCCIV